MVSCAVANKTIDKSLPVALVTGASSGIGEVFARKLSAKGYHTILVARRRGQLEKLAAELPSAEVLVADLTIDPDLRAIEQRIKTEPRLELLVNNAGFGIQGAYHSTDIDAQDRMHHLTSLPLRASRMRRSQALWSAPKEISSTFHRSPAFFSRHTVSPITRQKRG